MAQNLSNPNVLYITTHDQGIASSCFAKYGPGASKQMQTPNIDKLAEQGAMLTSHFGTAPQCSPARGSLITGKAPHINGLVGLTHRGFKIEDPSKTILQHFKNNGYATTLVGFQHEIHGDAHKIGYQTVLPKKRFKYCHELLPDVKEALATGIKRNNQGEPFWLSIGAKEVHLSWKNWTDKEHKFDPENVDVPDYLPDTPKVREHLGYFYAVLKSYDEFLGNVWRLVDDYNLRENTIIVVTTDHGIAHPRAKGTLYDPGNHDLMIWSHPNAIPSGKKIHSLLSSIDFAPTLTEMCGLPAFEEFQGKSYASLLKSPKKDVSKKMNEYVYTELTYHDLYNPMRAIRSDRYKYIHNYENKKVPLKKSIPGDIKRGKSYKQWVKHGNNTTREEVEFYDLRDDPLEENNLAKSQPEHPELKRFKGELEKYLENTNDPIRNGVYPAPKIARINNAADFEHIPNHTIWIRIAAWFKNLFK